MPNEIKKDWITKSGLRSVVVYNDSLGINCGYVGVTKGNHLYGKDYEEMYDEQYVAVHGGLTFSSGGLYPVTTIRFDLFHKPMVHYDEKFWWFGFDCGHAGDIPSREFMSEICKNSPSLGALYYSNGSTFKDVDYCVDECENLAQQLSAITNK